MKAVDGDRCTDGRCWSGPILIVSTKGGAVGDLLTWIRIMLSRHYPKTTTLGMMDCLVMNHVREEHAIIAFAMGREPHGAVLREVYVRAMTDHGGVLRSNCATYCFAIAGHNEEERCDALIQHYDWLARTATRREALSTPPAISRSAAGGKG